MNKVLSISLNGKAYQLEDAGYEAMQQYLKKAAAKLQGNPDKDEIMADLEQAIADKCDKYLSSHKNVVACKEVDEMLAQMGPVEDAPEAEEKAERTPTGAADTPKRLFKIREGAMIEGVCNGIAAYANVDVTIVRVAFIILTVLTGGVWIVAYILMAIFMPEARTAEDVATAQGKPFNTKTVLEAARARYEYWKKFGEEQSKDWKEHKEAYKKEWKNWKYEQKNAYKPMPNPKTIALQAEQAVAYGAPLHGVSRGFAGFAGAIGILVIVALSIGWAVGVIGVFTGGTIFGYFGGMSKVLLLALLSGTYYVVLLPVQAMVGDALRFANGKLVPPIFWAKVMGVLVWFVVAGSIAWFATHDPIVRDGVVKMYNDIVSVHWLGL